MPPRRRHRCAAAARFAFCSFAGRPSRCAGETLDGAPYALHYPPPPPGRFTGRRPLPSLSPYAAQWERVVSEPEAAAESANAAMRRYWNEVAGPRWVARQRVQEARNVEMAEQLLAAAAAQPGERVLDIGCGTGVTTLPYARAVGPSGHVTGVDISRPMLEAAERRLAESGLGNVTLLLADAQVHSFPPAAFDLLTSRLGVMFFADPAAAFGNLYAALNPGGRLCMAVWAALDENTHWRLPFAIALRHLGPPAPKPAHAPGPFAFGDREYLRGVLDQAGFAEVAITPRHFHIRGESAAAMAEHVGLFGAVQQLMDEKEADAATRAAIVEETEAGFAAYVTAEGVRLPATFLLVTGRRPL
jgi:ubiquinone/menaquinone biosynthesis C-methylase UbiE